MGKKNREDRFTLSQKVIALIIFVMLASLLPGSILTANIVSNVVNERVMDNSATVSDLLSGLPSIGYYLAYHKNKSYADEYMMKVVRLSAGNGDASVIIFDAYKNARVIYNPNDISNFKEKALEFLDKYNYHDNAVRQSNIVLNDQALAYIYDPNTQNFLGYVYVISSASVLHDLTEKAMLLIFLSNLFGLIVGVIGAIFLANHIKEILSGLEPIEVATLLQERNALLNSVKEGVVTINNDSDITLVNLEAEMLLLQTGISEDDIMIHKSFEKIMPGLFLQTVLDDGTSILDTPVQIRNTFFIVTVVPLFDNGAINGAIITFRKKTELEELANQLTGARSYADALRAQTHEFMNKMHVIMGLIEIKAYDELKQFTAEIANNRQAEAAYVVTRLKDITFVGFIDRKSVV